MNIVDSLTKIKLLLETSVIEGGTVGKRNLIRTSQPINCIHEQIKHDLVKIGYDPNNIKPSINQTKGEVSIQGFLKKKNQDIVLLPNNIKKSEDYIDELDIVDPFGISYSERILSINVRSQLSSVAKNFDTIFERTFAESFNLHNRLNKIVLGEVFLLPIREFDDSFSDRNIVKYRELGSRVENQLQKYIKYFSMINKRENTNSDFHKYERVCLLLVDFSLDTPKLYQSKQELIKDNIVTDKFDGDLSQINYDNFYDDITRIYNLRFMS